ILDNNFVDIVVFGEAEVTLCELVNSIERNEEINRCLGVVFKKDGKKIYSGERPFIKNLDELPFLDLSSFLLNNYDDSEHIALMTSRGCLMHCVFCSSVEFWPGYRTMSGERIFQEIKFHKDKYKALGHVNFLDLVFNGNMKTLNNFCDLMIKQKFNPPIDWVANAIIRPEMTPDILSRMREAGCERLIYGIESGSQRVLDIMKKKYRIPDADNVIKATHEAGIKVTANFMFGFPGEAEEDFQMTLDFIKRNSRYLDRAYPSRTFCAIEEHSYLSGHLEEFGIKSNPPNHLYWESLDGKNTYPERLGRCEEFCNIADSLGVEIGCGVQTSVELDRWFSLGHYYECKKNYVDAINCFLKYYELDDSNEVIIGKIKYYSRQIETGNQEINIDSRLKNALAALSKKVKTNLQIMSQSKNTDRLVKRRFTWNIHYSCNYRCPYCFFEGKWDEYKERNIYVSVGEWVKYWNAIYEKYGNCYMLITGGEPFTYPNFIELIERLSQIHYPINISTNASGDLESFVQKVDPEKVSLSVSFQPNFVEIDSFLNKVELLRRHKFNGCINFVAYPPFIKDINLYIEKFKSIGERLKVIPFWGKYQEKEYPLAYTSQERAVIGIDGTWLDKARKKNSLCQAGYNSGLVFPDGKVARCGQVGERFLVGNFFDSEFKLLDTPLSCDAEYCPCDEDKLFNEEGSITASYKDQSETEDARNSLLNDKEYNSGKIILQSSPKTIFIQAAGPCNSSCVFCSRDKEYEIFNLQDHRRRFAKNLYPFIAKAETLVLTGSGEFLMLPEAENILEFFDSNFPNVEKFFSTNGSSLAPWVCEKIVNSKSKYTIHASLHASNASLHKTITRMDNFHKILGQVKYLLRLRNSRMSPRVNLIFVATTINIDDLPNFVRLAAELGVDKVICYYNYIYLPTQKYLSCFFKQEFTNNILTEAEELADKLNIKIALPPKFGQKEYPKFGPCREAWSQIMFDSKGHVLPCDAAEDCGDILENGKDFMDIWNSLYYQNLRKTLQEGNCSCSRHCFRSNPASVNDFKSHVIYRGGRRDEDIGILWGDNF
ncbi:MAG: radical SAM protein, partial [Candidatus Omnitrophica bacterium]|nr:radical SAM protein [Candidatus Omnitrophota bacterium]